MNWDEQCSDKYIHCTYIVHTLYKHVHEIHVFVHTCLELVHKMYILGTYIECTSSCLYVQRKMQKAKICRCLNHYASSIVLIQDIVIIYIYVVVPGGW